MAVKTRFFHKRYPAGFRRKPVKRESNFCRRFSLIIFFVYCGIKQKTKWHGIGIVLPVPCRFAVIGFGVCRFAGHRVDGPGAAAGGVQLPLLLFRELLVGDIFFHVVSFRGMFGFPGGCTVI